MQRMLFGGRPKEAEVLRAIREYLVAKRVWHYRSNSGSMRDATSSRWISFGTPGLPDIQAIYPTGEHRGKLWGIEVKRPMGALSDNQIKFLCDLRTHGAIALVAEGVEDVERCLADAAYCGQERYARLLSTASPLHAV